MAIEFNCKCGRQIKAPDEQSGGVGRCPSCNIVIRIPEKETSQKIKEINSQKTAQNTQRRKKLNLSDTLTITGICLAIGIGVFILNQRQQEQNNEILEKIEKEKEQNNEILKKIEQENKTAKYLQEQKNSSPKKIEQPDPLKKETYSDKASKKIDDIVERLSPYNLPEIRIAALRELSNLVQKEDLDYREVVQSLSEELIKILTQEGAEKKKQPPQKEPIEATSPESEMLSHIEGMKTATQCVACNGSTTLEWFEEMTKRVYYIGCSYCTQKNSQSCVFMSSIEVSKEHDKGILARTYTGQKILVYGKILNVGSYGNNEGWILLEGANNFGVKCNLTGQMDKIKKLKIGSYGIVFCFSSPEGETSPWFRLSRLIWNK